MLVVCFHCLCFVSKLYEFLGSLLCFISTYARRHLTTERLRLVRNVTSRLRMLRIRFLSGGVARRTSLSCLRAKISVMMFHMFFFFQAEDGIRDVAVTGVQTCALPI